VDGLVQRSRHGRADGGGGHRLRRGLARILTAGVPVVEVDRPDRRARRAKGKSDAIDVYAAATAALNGTASGTPKSWAGLVEAVRALRVTQRGAVKARTQTMNQLRALIVTAPADLREQLRELAAAALVTACLRLRPARPTPPQSAITGLPSLPRPFLAATLRHLVRRHQFFTQEISELDDELRPLIAAAAPALLKLQGVGTEIAGQLLACVGDNPDRLRSEAAFAHLCGVATIPASSGRTDRHRLNRGGDRSANNALHTIVLCPLRYDPRTRIYAARRSAQGLGTKEITRCLKRHVAREVFRYLPTLDNP
jgi:transposase